MSRMSSDSYIHVTYLRSQLQAAHEAIAAIFQAMHLMNAGVLGGEDLDAAIYAATDLLPTELRSDDMPTPGNSTSEKMAKALKSARSHKHDETEDLLV